MKTPTISMNKLLLALAAAGLMAGCSTTKLDTDVPVESRTPTTAVPPTGAPSGTAESQVTSVDLAAAEKSALSNLPRTVYFDYDSYVVKDDFRSVIDTNAKALMANTKRRVSIEGHTDARGGSEYNLALGQKRAEAVAKSLTLLGASESQMEAVSFGKERPPTQATPKQRMRRTAVSNSTTAERKPVRARAPARWAALAIAIACFAPAAQAGLFDDDDARKAILDLRQKVEQGNEQRTKLSDQMTQQAEQMRRSLLDLNNQIELLRADNAKLRGQNEQLARDVADLQIKQKDIAQGVDDRMRKLEPQKVTVDGKEFAVDPDEKRQYEDAMELLRKGDFAATANALTAFRKRYPTSGYTESALFWLGNSQYGTRQYAPAIASFRALVSGSPDHLKAPEALLAIANCQAELKDRAAARRTLDELLRVYPKSEAAQAGKERLASLK